MTTLTKKQRNRIYKRAYEEIIKTGRDVINAIGMQGVNNFTELLELKLFSSDQNKLTSKSLKHLDYSEVTNMRITMLAFCIEMTGGWG